MMKTILSKVAKRFIRDNEIGQSVVILALGMVGLLVVVGITVDISILFVRFSTLRRAVDSASIAAAGQMRQDRSIAEVGLAARQFIEFHNLNPRDVLVETCHTTQVYDAGGGLQEEDPDLCTEDQRKLVRVTAEIDSPTVFLRLVGFDNIVLRTSSISETATLDVVVVMDVSESMLNETSPLDWEAVNQGVAYVPPRAFSFGNYAGNPATGTNDTNTALGQGFLDGTYDPNAWFPEIERFWQTDLLGVTQEAVNQRIWYTGSGGGAGNPIDVLTNVPEANDNYQSQFFVPNGVNPSNQYHPRAGCRVRFFPYSMNIPVPSDLLDFYTANGTSYQPTPQGTWANFVPAYDFYGCCNDPGNGQQATDADGDPTNAIIAGNSVDPDGDFSDLVCQPFREARDATRDFIQRIDFVRGDRLAYVTFDRTAFLIDPDGDNGTGSHMIEVRDGLYGAVWTLNTLIGVRAEPNYYDWDEINGGWTGFARGIDGNTGDSIPIDYYATTAGTWGNPLDYNDYPVANNCPMQNAAMFYPFSASATRGIPGEVLPGLAWEGTPALYNVMTPDIVNDANWRAAATTVSPWS